MKKRVLKLEAIIKEKPKINIVSYGVRTITDFNNRSSTGYIIKEVSDEYKN